MKKVLFFTPFAYWRVHAAYEVVISKALETRGATVDHICCDEDIPFCDIHDGSFPDKEICRRCTMLQNGFFSTFKLNYEFLNKYLNKINYSDAKEFAQNVPDNELLDFEYKGRPLGLWIQSSVFTYFRINKIDLSNTQVNKRFRQYLMSGILIFEAFQKILETYDPEVLFMFNGRFFTFRIPLELAREKGIRVIVHDRGFKDSSLMLKENEVMQGTKTLSGLWQKEKVKPLSQEQIEKTTDYILQREQGKNTGWFGWQKGRKDTSKIMDILNIGNNQKVISFFTSSDDEMAAFKEWKSIIPTQEAWIEMIIGFLRSNPDIKGIIRVHPNTGKTKGNFKENRQFLDFFNAAIDGSLPNLEVVYPDDEINSYQIIEISDAVAVYFSTVAVEAAARLKPALVCGGGPYKDLDFLKTLADPNEFDNSLLELTDIQITRDDLRMCLRFIHTYFLKASMEFKLVEQTDPFTPKFHLKGKKDLLPGNDENLDMICDGILYDKPIYDFKGELLNPTDAENEIIEDYFYKLKNINEEVFKIRSKKAKEEISEIQDGKPLLSVIIPTYKRSDVLKKCLDALKEQTLEADKFEVIVIDDGSPDSTREMISNYSAPYKLSYIKQTNSGPGAARNKGIRSARSELILIINDDTISEPDNLEKHLEAHKKYKNEKVAVLGTFSFLREAQVHPFIYYAEHSSLIFAYNIMKPYGKHGYRFFWTCNISLPKTALLDAGFFDEDFAEPMMEDTEIGYRLEKNGYKVLYDPDAKSEHYDNSLNTAKFAKRQEMLGRNVVKFLRKHPEMLQKEADLFGFKDLSENTIKLIKQQVEKLKPQMPKVYEILESIETLEIYNPNFIPVSPERHITGKELIANMEKYLTYVHFYNYFIGILNQIEKTSGEEEEYTRTSAETQATVGLKPKILLTMYGWDHIGGGTLFPKETAKRFVKKGYEVAVFYISPDKSRDKNGNDIVKDEADGVTLYRIHNRESMFLLANDPELEIEDREVLEKFSTVLDEYKPNVVHFFNFLGLSFAIAREAKKRDVKTFYSPENYHLVDPKLYMIRNNLEPWHGTDLNKNSTLLQEHPELRLAYNRRIIEARKILNEFIDYTFAISERVREILIDFGAKPDKVKVVHQIPQGEENINRNIALGKKREQKVRFGFMGTLIPHKGAHVLTAAAQLLNEDRAEYKLYGYGAKEYALELKKLDKKNVIEFKGSYEQSSFNEIAAEVDVMVIPSIWEECAGLVILESIAMGIPVIVARIGGMPDFVIEGVNGFLYPHHSARNLADVMNRFIKSPGLIDEMSKNCKLPLKFEDYVDHVLNMYSKILKEEKIKKEEMEFKFKEGF